MRQTHSLDWPAAGADEQPLTWLSMAGRLRQAAARHGEQVIAEIPATLRRFRLVLAVVAVAVPAFLLGILVLAALALHVRF